MVDLDGFLALSDDFCSVDDEDDEDDDGAVPLTPAVPNLPTDCAFFREEEEVLRWGFEKDRRLSLITFSGGLLTKLAPPPAVVDVLSSLDKFRFLSCSLRCRSFSLTRYTAAIRNGSPKTAANVRAALDSGSEGASRCTRYLW